MSKSLKALMKKLKVDIKIDKNVMDHTNDPFVIRKKEEARKLITRFPISVDPNMKDFSDEPFFIAKTAFATEFLIKNGFTKSKLDLATKVKSSKKR